MTLETPAAGKRGGGGGGGGHLLTTIYYLFENPQYFKDRKLKLAAQIIHFALSM